MKEREGERKRGKEERRKEKRRKKKIFFANFLGSLTYQGMYTADTVGGQQQQWQRPFTLNYHAKGFQQLLGNSVKAEIQGGFRDITH